MKLLDLFCGAGGAAMGYARAGFDVVGVDVVNQPNYPFTFVEADALTLPLEYLAEFDAIHASPPCQHFTRYRNAIKDITDRYDDLVAPTLDLLEASGLPYVVENVPGAPIRPDVVLCGSMFGLDVRRHRWFQVGGDVPFMLTHPCNHGRWTRRFKSSTGRRNLRFTIEVGAWDEKLEDQKEAMGVDWGVTVRELSEAVPPAYTEWLGGELLAHLRVPALAEEET